MKLFAIFTTALLSLAVNAEPVPVGITSLRAEALANKPSRRVTARDAAAEKIDLIKRAQLTCKIVNVVTTVDCHFWPTHASSWEGMSNYVVTSFAGSTSHDFNCYDNGENVGGVT